MNLYGELLESPLLRFDYSSQGAVEESPRRGLSRYGPYDSDLFQKEEIRAVVLFPKGSERQRDLLITGLRDGEGYFRGFQSYFQVALSFSDEDGMPFRGSEDLRRYVDDIASGVGPPDLVYVIVPDRPTPLYTEAKSRLLSNGIPSQMVIGANLTNTRGRQYTLENLALASYAKVGGTPWTVSASGSDEQLVLGVSRAQDAARNYLVGYVIIFTKDGDFLLVNSKAPVIEWEAYVRGLSELVRDAVIEFRTMRGTPSSITVHFHKRPGQKEIDAITRGLMEATEDIPFAIIHLNEYSNFRLFDSRHGSYVPPTGLKVTLGSHEALLMLDGRRNGERRKVGVPRVLHVRLDKRSTIDVMEFARLVQQVNDFAYINWRGFNAAAIPITLNYSKLIALMVAELGIQTWNATVTEGRLRDKAWFL